MNNTITVKEILEFYFDEDLTNNNKNMNRDKIKIATKIDKQIDNLTKVFEHFVKQEEADAIILYRIAEIVENLDEDKLTKVKLLFTEFLRDYTKEIEEL